MWGIFAISMGAAFAIDQITKLFVVKLRVPHCFNKAGPLGIRERSYVLYRFIRVIQWGSVPLILAPLLFSSDRYIFLGAGLIVGGSLGNIFDHRIRGGAVDFIPLFIPRFDGQMAKGNLSDISIIGGFWFRIA